MTRPAPDEGLGTGPVPFETPGGQITWPQGNTPSPIYDKWIHTDLYGFGYIYICIMALNDLILNDFLLTLKGILSL